MKITGRAQACIEAVRWRISTINCSRVLKSELTDAPLGINRRCVTEAIAGLQIISVNRSRSRKLQITIQSIQLRALIRSFIAEIGTYCMEPPRFSATGLLDIRTSNSFSTSSKMIRRGSSMGVIASGWGRGGSQS